MISETKFAGAYSSFWKSIAGNSENVIRQFNLTKEAYSDEIESKSAPERHALINEMGFNMFTDYCNTGIVNIVATSEHFTKAKLRVSALEGAKVQSMADPSIEEMKEATDIANALQRFLHRLNVAKADYKISPNFCGCGIINSCQADLIVGNILVEVKSGNRAFRSVDIRQLLTYCALNFMKKDYIISNICCVNPRRGTYVSACLESISLQISGKTSFELLSEIVYFISSEGLSS